MLDGERIELTPLEFGVVACLIDRKGQTVTRRALVEKVWGYDHATAGSNGVDVVGRSLRKKLGDRAPMIETVRGRGYRMRDI